MRCLFACACALLAVSVTGASARAASPTRTQQDKLVHWELPIIGVAVDAGFSSQHVGAASIEQALEAAVEAWNALPEMVVRFERAKEIDAAPVKVRFCRQRWQRPQGLLGHTEFEAAVATGLVTSAVIEVNDCDFRFVGPEEVAPGHLDLQAVLTHELGHVLGLAHSADPAAVMFTSTGTVRQRRPGLDDRAGLVAIYGPTEPEPSPSLPARPATPPPDRPEAASTPPVYTGGKENPVPFELPWPLDAGKQSVKFVPTVLPVASRAPPQAPTPAPQAPQERDSRALPREVSLETKLRPPSRRRAQDEPVAVELSWPEPARLPEHTIGASRPPAKANQAGPKRAAQP